MTYSVDELREQYNLSTEGGDKEYTGKNAENGHYWASDPNQDGEKIYLGYNDDLETLLADNKLAVASKSTKYNHDTDVARGLAGLLEYKETTDSEEEVEETEPEMKPITYSEKVQDAKERVEAYEDKYINYAAEDHPFYKNSRTATETNKSNKDSSLTNKEGEDNQMAAKSFLKGAKLQFSQSGPLQENLQ